MVAEKANPTVTFVQKAINMIIASSSLPSRRTTASDRWKNEGRKKEN